MCLMFTLWGASPLGVISNASPLGVISNASPLGVPADLQSASSENAASRAWRYEKPTAGDYKSPIKRSSLFCLRIANPQEHLADLRYLLRLADSRYLLRLADLRACIMDLWHTLPQKISETENGVHSLKREHTPQP